MACGCNCAGLQNEWPIAQAGRCDCLADCFRAAFEKSPEENTPEAFNECRDDCLSELAGCNDACVADPTDAAAALVACEEACQAVEDACLLACGLAFEACDEPCDDIEDVEDSIACHVACATARESCEEPCDNGTDRCKHDCQIPFFTALKPILADAIECAAECCAEDEAHPTRCGALCAKIQSLEESDARIAEITCLGEHILFYQDFGPGNPHNGWVYDENDCEVAYQLAVKAAANKAVLCAYDCEMAFSKEYERCDEYDACGKDCEEAKLAAELACLTAADGSPECINELLFAYWDCLIDCCFQRYGADTYTRPYKECKQTLRTCQTDAQALCPAPGEGPGEPCEDPDSEACTAAKADQQECADDALAECNEAWRECVEAIEADPPCSPCVINLGPV